MAAGTIDDVEGHTMWYSAHVIISMRYKDGQQDDYPIWENVILVDATSPQEARAKAQQWALDDTGDDDESFVWNGRPAAREFAGIRKLMSCVNADLRPDDGTEVTYLQFTLQTEEDLKNLVDGEAVHLVYESEAEVGR